VVPVRIASRANGLILLLVSVPVRTVLPVNQMTRPKQPLTIVPTVALENTALRALLVAIVLPVQLLLPLVQLRVLTAVKSVLLKVLTHRGVHARLALPVNGVPLMQMVLPLVQAVLLEKEPEERPDKSHQLLV